MRILFTQKSKYVKPEAIVSKCETQNQYNGFKQHLQRLSRVEWNISERMKL